MRKLLTSSAFATAPRLRSVLAYLLTTLDDGTVDQVTEQSIGQAVFGRPAGYNASEDNIVRVTIRHLRTRLDEYYRSEGKDDPYILIIPKGKYIPSFVPREPAQPKTSSEAQLLSGEPFVSSPEAVVVVDRSTFMPADLAARPVSGGWSRWAWLFICVAVLLGFVAGFAVRATLHRPDAVSSGVLGLLCHPGDDVLVVVVDSNLQAYRQIFGKQVSLDDYIHREYAKGPIDSTDPRIANAQRFSTGANETNVSSAIIAAAVRQALEGRHIIIKQPHDVSMREFQNQENVILLGGPWINPWGQLFENRLNFRLLPLQSEPSSSQIHNYSPRAGEPADYVPHMDGNLNVNYVRIAILPNFEKAGRVILIGATSAEALEAGGTFVLSKDALPELLKVFHVRDFTDLPPLEFVLEVRGLNSVPGSRCIVAERTVPW